MATSSLRGSVVPNLAISTLSAIRAAGVAQEGEFRVNYSNIYGVWPAVAMDAGGDAVVAWQGSVVNDNDINSQRFQLAHPTTVTAVSSQIGEAIVTGTPATHEITAL